MLPLPQSQGRLWVRSHKCRQIGARSPCQSVAVVTPRRFTAIPFFPHVKRNRRANISRHHVKSYHGEDLVLSIAATQVGRVSAFRKSLVASE